MLFDSAFPLPLVWRLLAIQCTSITYSLLTHNGWSYGELLWCVCRPVQALLYAQQTCHPSQACVAVLLTAAFFYVPVSMGKAILRIEITTNQPSRQRFRYVSVNLA